MALYAGLTNELHSTDDVIHELTGQAVQSIETTATAIRDDPRSSVLSEELPYVVKQEIRLLQCSEVATAVELRPMHNIVVLLGVTPNGDVFGEDCDASGYAGRLWPLVGAGTLVVESARGTRGAGKPVEHHIGEQTVAVDRVLWPFGPVGPLLELLDDPGQLAGR